MGNLSDVGVGAPTATAHCVVIWDVCGLGARWLTVPCAMCHVPSPIVKLIALNTQYTRTPVLTYGQVGLIKLCIHLSF